MLKRKHNIIRQSSTDTASVYNSRANCYTQMKKKILEKKTIKLNKTLSYLNELKTYKLGGVEQFQIRFDILYIKVYRVICWYNYR